MNYFRCAMAVLICILFVPVAFSQEATMVLKHKQITTHERTPVTFNHEQHASRLDCIQCHHDYDKYGNNRGGEDKAQMCSNCHGKPGGEKKVLPLTEAFHAQCKKCHERIKAEGKTSGPVMCGECHVRK